jgi:hypothetical protein
LEDSQIFKDRSIIWPSDHSPREWSLGDSPRESKDMSTLKPIHKCS